MTKRVNFNIESNEVYMTYSIDEYDRYTIDHVLYRKCYNKLPKNYIENMYTRLYNYINYEMVVHKDSLFL